MITNNENVDLVIAGYNRYDEVLSNWMEYRPNAGYGI